MSESRSAKTIDGEAVSACDDIVIGAGPQGLLTALHLSQRFSTRTTLIQTEQDTLTGRFPAGWRLPSTQSLASPDHHWQRWVIKGRGRFIERRSVQVYDLISVDRLRERSLRMLRQRHGFRLVEGKRIFHPEEVDQNVIVEVDGERIVGKRCFDTRIELPPVPRDGDGHVHLVRQEAIARVHCPKGRFDERTLVWMDFDAPCPPGAKASFGSLLPIDCHRAMIELHIITNHPLPDRQVHASLDGYIDQVAGAGEVEILERSHHLWPMNSRQRSVQVSKRIYRLSPLAGIGRSVSGYVSDDLRRFLDALGLATAKPGRRRRARNGFRTYVDRVVLNNLNRGHDDLFLRLAHRLRAPVLERYLSGPRRRFDGLRVLTKLPLGAVLRTPLLVRGPGSEKSRH
ncbi:MAG: lycopene cyclase family protein [Geminicoccaceae bacterium]